MDYAEHIIPGTNAPMSSMHELPHVQMGPSINVINDFTQISMNNTYDDVHLTNITQTMLMDPKKKNNSVVNSSIMFASGFLGNMLALVVLIRSKRMQRKTIFYKLVAGLTVTDLLGTSLTSPIVIAVYMNNFKWIGGTPMCNFFAFEMIFSGYSTMLIVCMMAFERVICIKHPYYYHTRMTKMHAFVFLIGCWGFAAIMASLPLMGFGNIVLKFPWTWCFFDYYSKEVVHKTYNYLFALLALAIISTTVTCNITVMYTLLYTNRKQSVLQARNGENRRYSGNARRYAECQMLVLLIGITVVFSTCYIPLMVRVIMNQTGLFAVDRRTDLLMIRLASLNQILDPWVYILFRRELLQKIIETVKYIFGKETQRRESESVYRRHSSQRTSSISIQLQSLQRPSAISLNDNTSCWDFCMQCIFYQPQRGRFGSIFSSDGEECMGRPSVVNKSPSLNKDNMERKSSSCDDVAASIYKLDQDVVQRLLDEANPKQCTKDSVT